jgi:hypothetical protein
MNDHHDGRYKKREQNGEFIDGSVAVRDLFERHNVSEPEIHRRRHCYVYEEDDDYHYRAILRDYVSDDKRPEAVDHEIKHKRAQSVIELDLLFLSVDVEMIMDKQNPEHDDAYDVGFNVV